MDTILIATDFSAAAENAMNYGAQLARHINASVLLLHVYQLPISMNEVPVMTIPVDELRKGAEAGLERCTQELLKKYPGLHVKTESRLGDAADEIKDVSEAINPFAVVVGSYHKSGLERMLFGSTSHSIIRTLKHPVIAVPSNYNFFKAETIVLATDFQNVTTIPSAIIKKVLAALQAELHIVHVKTQQADHSQTLLELQDLSPVYHTIEHDDVKDGLLQYVHDVQADLLMILPHEHNIIERLFFRLHAEAIISDAKIPVVCISS